jgi:hypothetical protein
VAEGDFNERSQSVNFKGGDTVAPQIKTLRGLRRPIDWLYGFSSFIGLSGG